jgi:flagellar M-ring protein FliF
MIQGQLGTALRRTLAVFGRFSPGQKAATICTVLALGVGGFLFSSWAGKPSFAPLYGNLSGTDASAIVDKLNSGGTPYRLADGGQTIMVPQDKVYDLRLSMSGAGLPAGKDTGYALLDKQGVTTSEFMQHVGYQRALEGELANTIGAIDGVHSATVHLAVPQKDVFTEDEQKPTASVLVATAPGQQLAPDQVQAIVHLVSSSVVGLAPEQVTVADATGKVLSSGGEESGGDSGGNTRAQQTQSFEQRMNSSVQQMVDQVVGSGHAVVKITADLNFDRTDTKSQTYAADPKLPPLSQSKSSENYTGAGMPSGGVLGPDNIQVPTGGTAGTGKYARTSQTQDNAVGVVTQTVQSAPGAVRRLSVAVLLDKNTASGVDTAAVQELVSSAVGLDAKRGDTVAVTALPFDKAAADAAKQALTAAQKAGQRTQLVSMVKTGGAALLVLVLLFGAWRSSRRKRRDALTEEERAQLAEMQAALDESRARALVGGGQAPALEPAQPNPQTDNRQLRNRELAALVEQQPDEVAQLLRGWLADKKG